MTHSHQTQQWRSPTARRHVTFDTKLQEQEQEEQEEDRAAWAGWDNPFHLQGELSQEADTILALWRRGCLDTYRDGHCHMSADSLASCRSAAS